MSKEVLLKTILRSLARNSEPAGSAKGTKEVLLKTILTKNLSGCQDLGPSGRPPVVSPGFGVEGLGASTVHEPGGGLRFRVALAGYVVCGSHFAWSPKAG